MKKIVQTLALAGLMTSPLAAMADNHESAHKISANINLYSDYVFRGISQTGGDPAVQGGLDYTHASGIYLGTWASNVGWIEDYQVYESGNMEIDLYGGYRGALGPVSYDLGIITYIYPGEADGATDADTTEIYAAASWKWFTLKYSVSVSDETFGFADSDGSDYLDFSASVPLGETGLTFGAHWGTFNFENNPAQDYDDWRISLAYDLGKLGNVTSGMTVGLAYSDTDTASGDGSGFSVPWEDGNGQQLGESTTYFWISKAF